MSRTEFGKIMMALRDMYKDKFSLRDELAMEIWYQGMKDMDFEQTKQSLVFHVKESKFPPTLRDIREQYNYIEENKPKDEWQ